MRITNNSYSYQSSKYSVEYLQVSSTKQINTDVITGVGDLFILAKKKKKCYIAISKDTHNTENMFHKLLHINFF